MTINIQKMKQAALAATQGEWIANTNGAVRTHAGDESTRGRAKWVGPFKQQDADFVATANPSAVLELITRLEAAEAAEANQMLSASARQFKQMEERLTAAERDAAKWKSLYDAMMLLCEAQNNRFTRYTAMKESK